MKFFSSLYRSFFDVEWLRSRRTKAGNAWSYFFLFITLLSVIGVLIAAVFIPRGIEEVKKVVQEKVPAEFQATISQGVLSVKGVPQPYIIKEDGQNRFIAVIDTATTSPLTLKDYLQDEKQSGVLVDREKVEFFDAQNARGQTQYWKDVPNTTVDRQIVLSWVDKISPAFIALFLIIFAVVVYIAVVVGTLLNILFVSVIVLIISSIAHREWKFGELFAVGLYAITLPLLISVVFQALGINVPHVEFLALLAFMLAIVFTRFKVAQVKESDTDSHSS